MKDFRINLRFNLGCSSKEVGTTFPLEAAILVVHAPNTLILPPSRSHQPPARATMLAIKRHRRDSSGDRAPTVLSFRRKGDQLYTTTNNMPKGFNTCNWLIVSSTEQCGKSCLSDFCKVHLVKLRRVWRSQPCRECGLGVTNKQQLCYPCGYRREWRRANKAIQREFGRLAAIEI